MYCPKCGTQNDDNNYQCTQCGEILHPVSPAPAAVVTDSGLATLFPYKNGPALAAYYCGVFSIIPFICMALGIIGLILGLKGLRNAREHPEVKGKVHAWVGIVAGGFFGLAYLALTATLVYFGLRG